MENNIFDDGIVVKDGYSFCPICNQKTVLVIKDNYWKIDSEPYKSGEVIEDGSIIEEIEDTKIEITGHYCLNCWEMRSLSIRRE